MTQTYEIFEKRPRGDLFLVGKCESLGKAKLRFFFLTLSTPREYLVWDSANNREVDLGIPAA